MTDTHSTPPQPFGECICKLEDVGLSKRAAAGHRPECPYWLPWMRSTLETALAESGQSYAALLWLEKVALKAVPAILAALDAKTAEVERLTDDVNDLIETKGKLTRRLAAERDRAAEYAAAVEAWYIAHLPKNGAGEMALEDWFTEPTELALALLRVGSPPYPSTARARAKVLEEALEEIRDGYAEGKSLEWMYGTAVAALSPELVEEALS